MNRSLITGTALAGLLALSTVGAVAAGDHRNGGPSTATRFHALTTSDRLVTFSSHRPCDTEAVKIRGLARGESLVGIDVRPLDGRLYGVGRSRNATRLYTIDTSSGRATFVTDLRVAGTGDPIVLDGKGFGVDFNPAADALRIVSSTGQNFRALPSARVVMGTPRALGDTFVDGNLSYSDTTAVPRPTAKGIGGAAYTNPDNDPATGTTLYDLDTRLDDLVTQAPPNDGTLVPVGDLGRRVGKSVGFDIAPGNIAWVAFERWSWCGSAALGTVDLATGRITIVGRIGSWGQIEGLAVAAS